MIKNWSAAITAILAVSALGLLGCAQARAEGPAPLQGVVEFEDRAIGFEVGGRLLKVPAERGSAVKAGDLLATIDDSLERAARDVRRSDQKSAESQLSLVKAGARREDVNAAEAAVRGARSTEQLLKKKLARERKLHESGVTPSSVVEDLEGQLARATAEREGAEQRVGALRHGARPQEVSGAASRVESASAAVKLEDEKLERHELRSPIDGSVTDVHALGGEIVAAGAPVVSIADTGHPYVDVFVPQGSLGGIAVGVKASVRVDATPGTLSGHVEYVSPRTEFTPRYLFSERERSNLVVRVRVRVDDPERQLHAGVPAFVNLSTGAR